MDRNLPGSSLHDVLQARILEQVAMTSSKDIPDPGIEPTSLTSPASAGRFYAPLNFSPISLPQAPGNTITLIFSSPVFFYILHVKYYTHTHTHIHTHNYIYSIF